MENEIKDHVIHTALDALHIPAGPVIIRLVNLVNTMKVLRMSLLDSIQCRVNAVEKLTRLAIQLSLPAIEQTPIALAVKNYNIQIQRDVEAIISDLAAVTPGYLPAEGDAAAHGGVSTQIAPSHRCVLEEIGQERVRQDAKWGVQDHQPMVWLSILGEEYGELAEAINETVFDNGPVERQKGGHANIRREAIQVAAVAAALVENLDRAARTTTSMSREGG